jgi:hypothetical protein
MKSYAICPISDKKVNERTARVNAIITVLLLLTFILSGSIVPVIFLGLDFFLRAAGFPKISLLAISSQNILKWLEVRENYINAGPKIFAARIGLLFSGLIILAFILSGSSLAYILACILMVFSFLEGVFGICVACEIYPFLFRLLYAGNYKTGRS